MFVFICLNVFIKFNLIRHFLDIDIFMGHVYIIARVE